LPRTVAFPGKWFARRSSATKSILMGTSQFGLR
jgi:hypothetical protein